MRIWNRSHHGTWHLYGHSHGSLEHSPNGRSFDVGVNLWDYKPLSFEQVYDEMNKRKISKIDHHEDR
jgi:calcineurin-like phosphoesterase family protein